ncbi:MAG: hypothetical protein ACOH2R_26465 [Pseudomonas sp.]
MKKFIPIFLVYFLFGCATPNEMREGPPTLKLSSTKSSKTVALCVTTHWENAGFGGTLNVNFRPTGTGFTVAVRNESIGSTQFLADIYDTETGSTTHYFKGAAWGAGAFDTAIKECQ